MAMTLITIVSVLSIYQSSLLVSASPFPLGPKIPLQCPSAGPYQAACWASLEVSRYYREWIVSNGPRCDSIGLRDNAAACFIALTTGESFSCGSTGAPSDESKLCPLATFDLGHYTPQEAYVLRAIYGLWKWFQSISTAIETTDPTPGLQLIAAQFDRPNRRFDMTYISFWQTLAAGLFDTPIPGTKSTIVTVYMEEARVNPQFGPVDEAVIPFIFSAATAPYVFSRFDWDPTTPFPMNHIQQYRETLSGGLANLQAGVDPWIALTANGTFATYQL